MFWAKNDWRQNSNNFKNLTPGATKNSLNATKRIIKKAYLEPKLLNFERCSFVPTKLPRFSHLHLPHFCPNAHHPPHLQSHSPRI